MHPFPRHARLQPQVSLCITSGRTKDGLGLGRSFFSDVSRPKSLRHSISLAIYVVGDCRVFATCDRPDARGESTSVVGTSGQRNHLYFEWCLVRSGPKCPRLVANSAIDSFPANKHRSVLKTESKPIAGPRLWRNPDRIHCLSAVHDLGDFAWTDQNWTTY